MSSLLANMTFKESKDAIRYTPLFGQYAFKYFQIYESASEYECTEPIYEGSIFEPISSLYDFLVYFVIPFPFISLLQY